MKISKSIKGVKKLSILEISIVATKQSKVIGDIKKLRMQRTNKDQ